MPLTLCPEIPACCSPWSHESAQILGLPPEPDWARLPEQIWACGPCSSALDVALHLAQHGSLPLWGSVLTPSQWAGRGQLRRPWISLPGNLLAAWRLPVPPAPWNALIPLVLGWCFALELRDLDLPVQVKWPNDVLLHGRKIGGILLEERGTVLLAGLGLNLSNAPADNQLRPDHACPAGNLHGLIPDLSIFALWLRLVHSARLRYKALLSSSTPDDFCRSLERLLAFLGQPVCITDTHVSLCGTCVGLHPDGGINILIDDTIRTFHSGSLAPET
ncbi:biotin--[acetyl-CoA-carboxylase] ligase [Desulfovibrionales bacterium]